MHAGRFQPTQREVSKAKEFGNLGDVGVGRTNKFEHPSTLSACGSILELRPCPGVAASASSLLQTSFFKSAHGKPRGIRLEVNDSTFRVPPTRVVLAKCHI